MKRDVLKIVIFVFSATALVLLDRFTKKMATDFLSNKPPKVLINNILELVYTENNGAAFGILKGKFNLFFVLTIVVLAALLVFLFKLTFNKFYLPYFICIVLIFSGAVGNFIDRLFNRFVVDFIYFKPIDFPVFNFADIYITIGCAILLISSFTIYRNE